MSNNQASLEGTKVLLAVFAMPGCGACEEYLPRFKRLIAWYQNTGVPFVIWSGGPIAPGAIPVLICDAAAQSEDMQAFADKLQVTATPTTCMMTRTNTTKIEGNITDNEINSLLQNAYQMNL